MTMSIEQSEERAHVGRWSLVRYLFGLAIGIFVLVALFSQRGDLVATWHHLSTLNWGWMLSAVLAELGSILTFAYLQHRTLRFGGSQIRTAPLFVISLANNAIAYTVPGEPAISSAFRYRQYRRRGATQEASGWSILTIMISQAIGLSSILLLGVLTTLFSGSHGNLTGIALVGLVIIVGAGVLLVRRDLLLRFFEAAVRFAQRVTGHPKGSIGERLSSTLQKMREIHLGPSATFEVVFLATLTWALDVACLLCAFGAVHAPIPWDGVLLAYGVAQIVAVLPIVPGGIGLVEGSLAVILVAYGSARVPALSTALVYRLVNYWLMVAIGWTAFAAVVGANRRTDRVFARGS
jgi:putative heme transporter